MPVLSTGDGLPYCRRLAIFYTSVDIKKHLINHTYEKHSHRNSHHRCHRPVHPMEQQARCSSSNCIRSVRCMCHGAIRHNRCIMVSAAWRSPTMSAIDQCGHICTSNCRREGCNCQCGSWHITPEEDEQLTHEKRQEEADQRDRDIEDGSLVIDEEDAPF